MLGLSAVCAAGISTYTKSVPGPQTDRTPSGLCSRAIPLHTRSCVHPLDLTWYHDTHGTTVYCKAWQARASNLTIFTLSTRTCMPNSTVHRENFCLIYTKSQSRRWSLCQQQHPHRYSIALTIPSSRTSHISTEVQMRRTLCSFSTALTALRLTHRQSGLVGHYD